MRILRRDKTHILDAIHKRLRFDGSVPQIKFLYTAIPAGDTIVLGSTEDKSNSLGFLKYLDLLGIVVGEETCAEIIELFELMHPWHGIINSTNEFAQAHLGLGIEKRKEHRATKYTDIIHPPSFQVDTERDRQIKFWASGRFGDLNEWTISENSDGEKEINCKVLEKKLFITSYYE
ncbi:hypothetical protein QUF64_01195 [Anaerolineales bacterium HSG6]|nr:hypothetical protein [Anaerolineales bacterium HSG6]MDM8530241.1 hypothetical protein [Anaerolineales bacterium HSG25]